ncbi:MAG: inner membrane protein [Candidatus Woesearchaeota archaeon]|nr:inner membrane protein [Candidatus Woesearchaeota archaeon]
MPDIDTASSKFGRKKFFRPLQKLTKHRGFFHSLLAGAIFAFLLGFVAPKEYALIFLLGYWLHVLVDGLTPKGVALLWPLPFRMKGKRRISDMEEWFLDILFIALIFFFSLNLLSHWTL